MSKFEDATLDIKKLDGGVNDNVTADLIGDDQWSYARNIYGIEGSVKSRYGSKRLSVRDNFLSFTELVFCGR